MTYSSIVIDPKLKDFKELSLMSLWGMCSPLEGVRKGRRTKETRNSLICLLQVPILKKGGVKSVSSPSSGLLSQPGLEKRS